MSPDPSTVEGELTALRRYFLLRYHDEVRKRYQAFFDVFPLVGNSRLDVVQVNGGRRVHFVYQRGRGEEHLVVIHDVTMEAGAAARGDEQRFVQRALNVAEPMVHFVLHPPYKLRFDEVEREAVAAVARHARLRPSAPSRRDA